MITARGGLCNCFQRPSGPSRAAAGIGECSTKKPGRRCRRPGLRVSTLGRGDRIRTCDLYVPNVALYQTELHPAKEAERYSRPAFLASAECVTGVHRSGAVRGPRTTCH